MPGAWRERVKNRLREVGSDIPVWLIKPEKLRAPTDPDELFGDECREPHFMVDKIDFIGRKLVEPSEKISALFDSQFPEDDSS